VLHQQLQRDGLFLTGEQKQTIVQLYQRGTPVKEIGVRFKISLPTLASVLREFDVPPRPTAEAHEKKPNARKRVQWNKTAIPAHVRRKIMNLRRKGKTMQEIALIVGFTRHVVRRFVVSSLNKRKTKVVSGGMEGE
jgi:DNA invertase Pin-like site-specific DNA recombinase